MPIKKERLEHWKELVRAATAGPWLSRDLDASAATLSTASRSPLVLQDGILEAQNAHFIAAAREAVPALIAELERLRALAEKVAAEHSQRVAAGGESHALCDVCWALTDWQKDHAPGTRARQAP